LPTAGSRRYTFANANEERGMPFRADPSKEYYAILALKEDAGPEEIRRAYRKLALHYHPDRNRGNPGAEERFKAISEAYGVLIDPEKRRLYDLSRHAGRAPGAGGSRGQTDGYSSQEDILRDLLRNHDAAAVFEELTREFQRMGFRFDDGFVRHMFFGGGRGAVFGGVFFGGPFAWSRGGEAAPGAFGRRRVEPWGPWLRAGRESRHVDTAERGEPRALAPGLLGRVGQAVRGIASALGRLLGGRGSTGEERGGDVTQGFPVTPQEARDGARRKFRLHRDGDVEEIVVTIPPGVRPGTRLRLRGKGAKGAGGTGDLYLRVEIP
jgi:curved DNA-binding protein CbpA